MKTITISLQDDVYEQVQKKADTHKISIEQVIVYLLAEADCSNLG